MAHAMTREIETLCTLIEYQYQSADGIKWPVLALVHVVDLLDDYWDIIENENGESDPDLAAKILDEVYEGIHSIIVHQQVPMTEEQQQAMEDQQVAELRDALEKAGQEAGLDFKILDLDQQLKNIQKAKEESDDNG